MDLRVVGNLEAIDVNNNLQYCYLIVTFLLSHCIIPEKGSEGDFLCNGPSL
jgi:hypothetical protein